MSFECCKLYGIFVNVPIIASLKIQSRYDEFSYGIYFIRVNNSLHSLQIDFYIIDF